MTVSDEAPARKPFLIDIDALDEFLAKEPRPLSRVACYMLACRLGTFTMREIATRAGWHTDEVWSMLVRTSSLDSEVQYQPKINALLTVDSRITLTVRGA